MPYSASTHGVWSFVQYGANVFATNYVDPIQYFAMGSSDNFLEVGGASPHARYLGIVSNFLVAIDTWTDLDGKTPQRIQWSDLDAPMSWTVDGVSMADFQDLLGDGGHNVGVVAGLTQVDAAVLQERAVWRMTHNGTRPFIFEFDLVEGARGTIAHGSIVTIAGVVYYLGQDGFYKFDGSESVGIGANRIDKTFFADADPAYFHRVSSAVDMARTIIFWSYVSVSATLGKPDKIIAYNWTTGEWSLLNVITEVLWHTRSFGTTLEDLDAFGDLDSIPVSFDSRQWQGGVYQLSAFDENHRVAHFSAGSLPARITSREVTMDSPTRQFVTEARPHIDAAPGIASVSVGQRTKPSDSPVFGVATYVNPAGFCPQRTEDQYLRFRLSVTASAQWSFATGIDVKTTMTRGRR